MNKLAFISLLLVAFVATGCIKTSSDAAVSNDGSATVKMSIGYKKEVIANLKAMIEAQMGGEEDDESKGAADGFAKFESGFDDKRVADEWKKLGLDVTKSSTVDKDGWKKVEIEGSVKNLTEYNRKHADAMKKMAADAEAGPMEALSAMDPGKIGLPSLPRFYKTDQPNIAKVVLNSNDGGNQGEKMAQFEDMSDEEREQFETALDQMRGLMGLDDLKIEVRVKLPGKILSVSNAKQDGENTLVFELLGTNFTVDTITNMVKTKGQMSATLQFDPKEFKIPLEDEPKAESKPASKPKDEKPKKDEDEKKKKDEDK